jgi:integrase
MPRGSKLIPTEVKSRKARGLAAWCVNVPAELSDTGSRRQLFFDTKKLADAECEKLKALKDNFGLSLASLSPARITQAVKAYQMLDAQGLDLIEAAKAQIAAHKQGASSVTLAVAFDKFAASKEGKSAKYLQEIRHARASFSPLHDHLVCDIQPEDLESILDRLPPASRNAKMRRLRSIFNLCIRRDWLSTGANPISKLDWADTGNKEVEIFPVNVIKKLLDHALVNDLEFLPYRVFTFFCGIRPEGELERMEWSDVRIKEKTVVLRAEITKTKRKRFVDLSRNAIEWLNEYKTRGGKMTGLVAPWTHQVRRSKHRNSYRECGIKKWIQQGARHSYCSYWLAKHKDANKLVLQSGHTDADTMWRLYHQGVTAQEARAFWASRPPKSARPKNVIRMAA